MLKIDLDEIEKTILVLQAKNLALLKKLSRFGVWILINGILFSIVASTILSVYQILGFERTLLIVLLLIFMSNVRQQFQRV